MHSKNDNRIQQIVIVCRMCSVDLLQNQKSNVVNNHDEDHNEAFRKPGYFQFPFPPYQIQVEFMQGLYGVLEKGGVGIFESPTGTGKSLSLICGALTWLRDFNQSNNSEVLGACEQKETEKDLLGKTVVGKNNSEPAWINEVASKRIKKKLDDEMKAQRERKEKYAEKLEKLRNRPGYLYRKGKRKHDACQVDAEVDMDSKNQLSDIDDKEDSELLLAEYDSDHDFDHENSDEEDCDEVHVTKIFYCSRTHSQLDQFVKEVKKSNYGATARVVSLGSRLNLCINDDVKKLRSITRINDRCIELQKNKKAKQKNDSKKQKKSKSENGCAFYDHKQLLTYKDLVLTQVKDVEELVSIAEEMEACPYYGNRYAIPNAELVVLPYNMLLHQATREACGIKLKGNVVIIDEAHNLIETISNIHSVEISGSQISRAHSQLLQYRERYKSRLKAKNLMYVKQILQVLSCLRDCLMRENKEENAKLMTINDFLFTSKIDNINIFKIKRYCDRSLISKKLNGFVDKYSSVITYKDLENNEGEEYISSPLRNIENFLECLTNANKDGRIFLNPQALPSRCSLKFLLLNPAIYFKSVVEEARAVIVAGGTMQPVSEFKQQLLYSCSLTSEDISEFSCDHVIPENNLLPIALSKGPSGVNLDFTYQSREGKEMMSEVSRVLTNLCSIVPGGLVCFFPSYEYKEKIVKHWTDTDAFQRINSKKKVFSEPRKASLVEQTLSEYGRFIEKSLSDKKMPDTCNGAILLCVVGGKMSEGINFSDDLGRCVVVVGLPYPNIKSPELKEQITYLERTLGPTAGQEHCENVCMKAVNQSIGRAIRHINDYSTIVLLDQRYARASVQRKLPNWILKKLQTHNGFGPAFGALRKFFVQRAKLTL